MDYRNHTVEDFVLDNRFRDWVNGAASDNLFWENWLANNPDKAAVIREARQIVLALRMQEPELAESEITSARTYILQSATEAAKAGTNSSRRLAMPVYIRTRYQIAAAFIAILMVSAIVYLGLQYRQIIRYATPYGQIREVLLPDGSKVFLNANSVMKTSRNWGLQATREVWLEGEAFFRVTHQPNNSRFLVHTGDLQIEVLGTTFNVNSREKSTQVVLNTGKVQVHLNKTGDNNTIPMLPGDLLQTNADSPVPVRKKVDPQVYSSWQTHKLIFDKTPVSEIAGMLETNYGLKVTFADPAFARRQISGTIPSNNQQVLLEALSALLNVEITRRDKEVIFSSRKKP